MEEHLLKTDNYVRFKTPENAEAQLADQKKQFKLIFKEYKYNLDEEHVQYFERSFNAIFRIPLAYALAKVHKEFLCFRPIISSCGSFPELFSIFNDEYLKVLVQDVLLTYIISSEQLINTLLKEFPRCLPFGAMLFSVDAINMYGNIGTQHGIEIIQEFVRLYGKDIAAKFNVPEEFIIKTLELIMRRNILQYGDTFWKQINGAAMGTSCAVNYAFLYMGLLEMLSLLKDYSDYLLFYSRFIDDGLSSTIGVC